ncbi:MAG: nicotinate (nicotinamide) nucleotide adenylyltransferase [Pirellula sp.]|jgi:nicotinate-nucleotide adenylyltransferase|nr:nicotinate (nicotinamide) nucleotide adenylyltransferase [Pirellula sp.]
MKIGIFGGSFDPIHNAHLILAECAREQLGLDQVRFVPAKISPLKQDRLPIDDKHRVEMVRLAINGNSHFAIDTRELDRGGISYTIDTLTAMKTEFPEAEFWLLMGADSLADFKKWKSPSQLLELCRLGVMVRPDNNGVIQDLDWSETQSLLPSSLKDRAAGCAIPAPILQISSSDLRLRCREERSIRYQVPASVEAYIRQHGLYLDPQG